MNKYRVHPMIEHAYRTIMDGDEIEEVVLEQRWLADEERWKAVLALCDDPQTREVLHAEFLEFVFIFWQYAYGFLKAC